MADAVSAGGSLPPEDSYEVALTDLSADDSSATEDTTYSDDASAWAAEQPEETPVVVSMDKSVAIDGTN